MTSRRIFLTAEWRNLVLVNYEVEPSLLRPFVPPGVELDFWNGRTFISLVAFQFLNTKVFGVSIPLHTKFDEVNFRFYVRREADGEMRRGVVFIREIVPRRAIAFVARAFYNENYVALPMDHEIETAGDDGVAARYRWKFGGKWSEVQVEAKGNPEFPREESLEQFITEHYWGYAAQRDGGCVEYEVKHSSWRVWRASGAGFSGEAEELYGREFAAVLRGRAASAFLAEGSAVKVMRGRKL